ncbi:hypothetical protein CC78DRAFT_476349 [Lojkania enalia]|uniref:U6 snRNA phosphodiesterase n=1 Tax=Lojkania enalia TaxID=147567 RepID=A0A9P4K2U0_9PLEO|nr:hypothetical protein CC78DRAFT_476349 [Didymosphaeria enalia]
MSLVQYPDSDSDGDEKPTQNGPACATPEPSGTSKRKRDEAGQLPPLPSAFLDLYSTSARLSTSDDPSLHGGRKRAVPHIEGNWPSHVYLEWIPSPTESEALRRLTEHIQHSIEGASQSRSRPIAVPDIRPSLLSPLATPLPLHISLSRTLQIRTEDREDFLETLASCLRRAAVKPFEILFDALKWVPNYERNRWFLVLGISKPPNDELNRLLRACNQAVEKCGHPGLYVGGKGDGPMEGNTSNGPANKKQKRARAINSGQEASIDSAEFTDRFHVSIAWNLVEPAPEWLALVRDISVGDYIKRPQVPFDAVKAKVGNTIHNIELAPKKISPRKGGGILGLG